MPTNLDRLTADLETYSRDRLSAGADLDELAGALFMRALTVAAACYDLPDLAKALRWLADAADGAAEAAARG